MANPSIRACLGLLALTAAVMGRVSAQDAILEATPGKSAPAGSTVTVKWKGPNGPGDYITVVSTGSPATAYLDYKPTSDGRAPVNPVALVLPAKPGAYEIRYVAGNPRRVLATMPFTVTEVAAAIEAPDRVAPDARFEVAWSGPNNTGDWVTIVAVDAPVNAYGSYIDARNGREDDKSRRVATLRAPAKTGAYELRYVQQGKIVIGTRAIEVTTSAAATTTPPASGAEATGAQGPVSGSGAAASSAAGPVTGGGATMSTAGSGAASSGGAPPPGSATGGDTTRTMPSTTGRVLTQGEGAVNTWSGWAQCQIVTRPQGAAEYYQDVQTQTWTISGPGTVDSGGTRYPAAWSVSGGGGMSRGFGGVSSYAGGDFLQTWWETRISGIAAPVVLSTRASDNRLVLTSAHARLQAQITAEQIIANESGSMTSPGSYQRLQVPIVELTLPVIEDVATSTRISGSSSPVVSYIVSPFQPAEARTTASCTWLFQKGVTFSALQAPPAPPVAKKTFPRPSAERNIPIPIRVLTPNGSEDWAVNSRQTVIWTHTLGTGRRFDIDISVDGGSTWLPLARNVSDDGSGNRGAFAVSMPAVGSTAGLVRVSPAGEVRAGDVSDSGFKLGAPWMTLVTPVTQYLAPTSRIVVQFSTNLGSDERYTIAVTYDNKSWQTVTTSGTPGQTFTVPITAPLPPGNGPAGMIRVTSNSMPTLSRSGLLYGGG